MKGKILSLALLFLCAGANAASYWEAGPGGAGLTVSSYRYFWDGTSTFVEVTFNEPISLTGCAPSIYNASTNPNPKMAHWYGGYGFSAHSDYLLKALMTAKETGRKIDVLWTNTTCSTTSGWMIWGVRMRPEVVE